MHSLIVWVHSSFLIILGEANVACDIIRLDIIDYTFYIYLENLSVEKTLHDPSCKVFSFLEKVDTK